jgi:hypothetical protein
MIEKSFFLRNSMLYFSRVEGNFLKFGIFVQSLSLLLIEF